MSISAKPAVRAVGMDPISQIIQVTPSVGYIRRALGENRAGRLLDNFIMDGERLVDVNYQEPITLRGEVAFTFDGQKIPPILLVRPEELKKRLGFYGVDIPVSCSERYMRKYEESEAAFISSMQSSLRLTLNYLENYLLVIKPNGKMIFISDDHTHTAYALALAKHLGIFDGDGALFVYDEHRDNFINPDIKVGINAAAPASVANVCRGQLEIDSFLAFTCAAHILEAGKINYVLTEHLNRTAAPEYQPYKSHLREGRYCLLKQSLEEIRRIKQQGGQVASSIDLDFLAFLHDPFFPEEEGEALKNVAEKDVLSVLAQAARESDFVTIATSPEFLNVPQSTIRRLVQYLVAAA
ncbi:MAG: hypothetical protein WC624_06235 [Candidatus Margulisiibacteriota bacterium]